MRCEPKGSGDECILGWFYDDFLFSANEYVMWRCVAECCLLSSDRFLHRRLLPQSPVLFPFHTCVGYFYLRRTVIQSSYPAFGSYSSWLLKCTTIGTNTGEMISSSFCDRSNSLVPGWVLWTMFHRSGRDGVTSCFKMRRRLFLLPHDLRACRRVRHGIHRFHSPSKACCAHGESHPVHFTLNLLARAFEVSYL